MRLPRTGPPYPRPGRVATSSYLRLLAPLPAAVDSEIPDRLEPLVAEVVSLLGELEELHERLPARDRSK